MLVLKAKVTGFLVILTCQFAPVEAFLPQLEGSPVINSSQAIKNGTTESVPPALRGRYVERLRLLIEYRKNKEWGRLYHLLSVNVLRGRTKERFVNDYRRYPGVAGSGRSLYDFVPKDTVREDESSGRWRTSGCAKLVGLKTWINAFVLAWRENDDWYFSDLDIFLPRDTSFQPCSYRMSHESGQTKRKA